MGSQVKIITRAVLDWDGNILEEDSYEYCGPVAMCKSSGPAPQPTDPYAQASAQYGLDTGTANYNAALNRTDSSNPLGSNTWSVVGRDGTGPSAGYGPYPIPSSMGGGAYGFGGPASAPGMSSAGMGRGGSGLPIGSGSGAPFGLGGPPTANGGMNGGSGAPIYAQRTSLTPWANSMLQQPIDTSGIPGMPGGPSLGANVNSAENATFGQEMQLLAPQEAQQSEQTQAQLEAEGAMPGSAAYGYGEKMLGLNQGAENTQAANQAVTTGMGELPMFYGLGSTSLQNQLAERNAPISEYEALTGNPSANVSAATPDISGAFGQQYQGQLAGYNANTATNNANTSAGAGALTAALIAMDAF